MRPWPDLADAELVERLRLDDAAFLRHMEGLAVHVPHGRAFDAAVLERALGYPWARPASSYLLRDGTVGPPDPDALDLRARHPLLAFGANGSPEGLARKLAHFDDPDDRTVLVLAGHLHGWDVGPAAMVTLYGSLPATIFPSPGTRVRASITWVTPRQLIQLTWSEISYGLGRPRGAHFEPDEPGVHDVTGFCAYASRWGAFAPHGEPTALAAVPARDRTAAPRTQRELLDLVAGLTVGGGAERLVETLMARFAEVAPAIRAALQPHAVALDRAHWDPFAGTEPG